MQRLGALNQFIDDLYHDQNVIKDGIVPASIVESSPNYRPECAGVSPRFGVWAHICGTDLVRGGDGTVFVLEDNLRVPSGVSYMLQNRAISVPGSTDVTTPAEEGLRRREGACQDFAHLAIGSLRSLGLPARYVSGYVETEAPEGMTKMVGSDASHAWFATFIPGWGWLDLDPTNDQAPPVRHVTLAWGRDYTDVAPLRGVLFGPTVEQQLSVSVEVARV